MKKLICVVLMGMVFFTACSKEITSVADGNPTEEAAENNQDDDTDEKVNAEYEAYAKRLLEVSDYMPQFEEVKSGDMLAVISTSMGNITVKLFPEEAPKTVENFVTHAENGYYDNLLFHRVIEGFMNQTGDPNGDSTGGESIWGEPFEDEFSPYLYQFRYSLAMANSGINTNGSQFYIVSADDINEGYADGYFGYVDSVIEEYGLDNILTNAQTGKIFRTNYADAVREKYNEVGGTPFLDYGHTVFGQVIEGMEVVDAINRAATDQADKPLEDIKILEIEITTAK